jgi:signal transduction histidine kinase
VVTIVDVDPAVVSALAAKAPDLVQLTHEALSNVGRHASAATCRISLRRAGADARLEIDDDGVGFDVTSPRPGMGLANLQSRVVSDLDGSFVIESSKDQGTTVRVLIPL